MNTPAVSVIVPNYNHRPFLEERLESILAQDFQDFELILLDDASTDGSQDLLEAYATRDARIRTEFNTHNSGSPFAQWNKGVAMARAPLVWMAESDDACAPGLLGANVAMMHSDPEVVLAFHQSVLVDAHGTPIRNFNENYQFVFHTDRWEHAFVAEGSEEVRNYLLLHNTIPNASAALFRKSAYEACGGAPTDMRLNGDWLLYARLLRQGKIAYRPEPLNYFRKHDQTQRHRARERPDTFLEIFRIVDDIVAHENPEPEQVRKAVHEHANWWIGSSFNHAWTRSNFRLNRQLYRRYSQYRKYLWKSMLITALYQPMVELIGKTPLKAPLKKIAVWLFPKKYL
ncbi:glycosyltransferase [bacterium]|nr:glycosyltransferase [bacterium]